MGAEPRQIVDNTMKQWYCLDAGGAGWTVPSHICVAGNFFLFVQYFYMLSDMKEIDFV